MENSMEVHQKTKSCHMIQQSHSWASIWSKLIQKDTCTPMFTAALFTIAKTWKQPKCPSRNEWIKKMWYIYIIDLLLSHKKEWNIVPFAATWMDLEIVILSEVTKNHLISVILGFKIWHKWTYLRNRFTDIENRLVVAKEKGGGGEWIGSLGLADANYYI